MIVHHLADGEALWRQPLKLALLQDGFAYHHNAWAQEGRAKRLPTLHATLRRPSRSFALSGPT
jgi:hypothetical protein